ncbi:hypothetical protein DLE60_05475 [Micromonospora globispora]|uniref:PH domain-containing protein n=1 Tax=Micromonospora globispora TaxID=1450148 RepID=A0A317KIV6_9ACTN|nr:PH domain-containing protein [Micromonospora globispora]PWU53733.1 hypothetical protein DLJ46_00725 [Micromonospora globispora]PWU61473.1 hypothetical protein DLE60_05475 [Micromonospora globispora]RQW81774.1 hypothetical protein DKL51_34680 [Micromonospora globispora]
MQPTQAPVVSLIRPPAGATADRFRVTAALVLAAAAGALAVFTERAPGSWLDLLLGPVPLLLALSAFVTAVLSARRPWRRPALLVWPEDGRLRVTPAPGFGWFVAGEILLLTGLTVPVVDGQMLHDPAASASYDFLDVGLAVLAAVLIVVLAAAVFQGRPRIDLAPAGIEVREPLGRRTVPWTALAPGTPARQPSARKLVLTVARPELVHRRGLVRRAPVLELTWLRVQPWFLTDVLRWYVDHPQERAALGTEAGNERLCRALGAR